MEYCKSCEFYDKEYDEFWQAHNDTGDPKDHFCRLYKDFRIPKGVREDKEECTYYLSKAEMDETR